MRILIPFMLISAAIAVAPGQAEALWTEDCYVCEGVWDNETGWVPGSIGCDAALPGEEGRVNCLQDMHGTECQIDQYELCEEEPTEDQLLVVLPGSPGVTAVTAHLGLRTTCRSRSDTSSDVFAIALY